MARKLLLIFLSRYKRINKLTNDKVDDFEKTKLFKKTEITQTFSGFLKKNLFLQLYMVG